MLWARSRRNTWFRTISSQLDIGVPRVIDEMIHTFEATVGFMEQSVDDLLAIEDMDEKRAGELIMTARAPWFEEQEHVE